MNKRKTAYWLSEGGTAEHCPHCQAELRYSGPRNPGLSFRCPDCEQWATIAIVETKIIEKQTNPICPECLAEGILKSGPYGQFWACVNWPKCKGKPSKRKKYKIYIPVCGLVKWQPYTDPHPEWREDWERGEELQEQWEAEEARKKALRRQRLDQKSFEW